MGFISWIEQIKTWHILVFVLLLAVFISIIYFVFDTVVSKSYNKFALKQQTKHRGLISVKGRVAEYAMKSTGGYNEDLKYGFYPVYEFYVGNTLIRATNVPPGTLFHVRSRQKKAPMKISGLPPLYAEVTIFYLPENPRAFIVQGYENTGTLDLDNTTHWEFFNPN